MLIYINFQTGLQPPSTSFGVLSQDQGQELSLDHNHNHGFIFVILDPILYTDPSHSDPGKL